MKNSFVEKIKIKDFQQYENDEFKLSFNINENDLNKELPLSVFLIEEILGDTEKWIEQEGYHYGWTIKSFSICLLWNIISCIGNEQDHIRHKKNIILKYISKSFIKLENNEDSPLLPEDFIEIWKEFDEEEKKEIKNFLIEAGKGFEDFPPLEKLNIIDTATPVTVDFDVCETLSFIPLTVETSSGLSGVVPTYSDDPLLLTSTFNSILSNEDTHYINNYHTWDLKNKKVKKNKDNVDNIKRFLSGLAHTAV